MLIPLAAMALWKKIAIGFGIFVFLFGHNSKEEINIAIEGMQEFTYEDGRGSVVVSTLDPRQGLVQFINSSDLIHYAMVKIDGQWVGDDKIKIASEAGKWKGRLFNPGERRIHHLKILKFGNDEEMGDFGEHHVEAHIFVKSGGKAMLLRKLEYSLSVSDMYRNAPEGSGMYWILKVYPNYISE
ncbi:MAG: hypothetical protein Q8R29_01755 [bacterium]|nr:hypothetical protein [bacterium]